MKKYSSFTYLFINMLILGMFTMLNWPELPAEGSVALQAIILFINGPLAWIVGYIIYFIELSGINIFGAFTWLSPHFNFIFWCCTWIILGWLQWFFIFPFLYKKIMRRI